MTQPMQHTPARPMGLKARVAGLLKQKASENDNTGMTIGQIGAALSLPKTEHGNLAALLVKLRDEGSVKAVSGQATSVRGRRFVKRYLWRGRLDAPISRPSGRPVSSGPVRAQVRVGEKVKDIGRFATKEQAEAAKAVFRRRIRVEAGLETEEPQETTVDDRRFLSLCR